MKLKRIISGILATAMSLTILPSIPAKAEIGSKIYTYDGYQVEYTVQNEWTNNQSVQVTVTNTDDESILNWALKYDAKGEINGLWNGSVYKQENTSYIIKNAGYNYEIKPNQSVNFGYTLTGEALTAPDKFEMCTKRTDKTDGYNVSFNVTQDWDTGFQGAITVNNTSSAAIEGWMLSFDSNFAISGLWNGKIISSNGTSYVVANEQWTSPIQPNSSVTIGFTAAKTAGITAVAENFKLSEVVIDETTPVIIQPETPVITADAQYDSENNAININWTSTNSNGIFEVLVSEDGVNFVSVKSLVSTYSYVYTPEKKFETLYIKIKQLIDNISAESNVITVTGSGEVINWEDTTDTDNDGLPDVYETYYYNTDPQNSDTDGDGLPDGYEVSCLDTDPTLTDTDKNGVSDANEDFDNDNLTNIKEYELGADPKSNDTDTDGLFDGDEVSLGTDLLNSDTDNDGLLDGEEGNNGIFFAKYNVYFNPLNPDTNGNGIFDGQEPIENQTVSQAVESHDGIVTNISVKMTTNDNLERNLSVESVYNVDVLSTDVVGLIGDPFDFNVSTEFKQATLTFTIDTNKLGDVSIEDLLFLYFDKENQNYQELETVVDISTNTVSMTTTHFSQYMVVNRNEWFAVWSGNPYIDMGFNNLPNQPNASGHITRFPSSKSEALEYSKTYGDSNYLLIDSNSLTWEQAQEYCESYGGHLVTITTAGESAFINSLISVGTRYEYWIGGIWDANCQPVWANGEPFVNDIATIQDKWGSNQSGYLVTGSGYSNHWMKGRITQPLSWYIGIGYICEWDKTVTLLDSDMDKFPDIYETKGLMLANGMKIQTNPLKIDTDDDGLIENQEILPEMKIVPIVDQIFPVEHVSYKYYFIMISNPTLKDSDYDGIDDNKDTDPQDNSFSGKLNYSRNKKSLSSDVEFTVNYRNFFNNNQNYSEKLSVLSSLFAADIYDGTYVSVTDGTSGGSDDPTSIGKLFGLSDVEDIKIEAKDYVVDKDDLSEIIIGHRLVEYKGVKREVIILSIRGTNGTNAEWSSNFDVGADTTDYTNATGSHPQWTNKDNHKGFDVTANRILDKVNNYLSRYQISDSTPKSILIVGHSRGAAIANLLGTHFENNPNYLSYTYTFAAPNTTTAENTSSYKTIFNIVNDDDIIPALPLEKWGFNKYGVTKSISIKLHYENKRFSRQQGTWEWLVGEDYNNDGGTQRTLECFSKISKSRNDLYELDFSSDGKVYENNTGHSTYEGAEKELEKLTKELENEKLLKFCKLKIVGSEFLTSYHVEVNYCPAYLMQSLSNMTTSVGPTLGRDVKGKYRSAKASFVASSGKAICGGMEDPHLTITYYLIAHNNFVNKV
jgi:hypothetical protein